MEPVRQVEGRAYPFGMKNVDTDIIIPAHWLKTITREGLGRGAFEALRKDPDNVFDRADLAGAPIIVAGDNFGCGSSREHAAWALLDMGVKAVIAPSFSDIFSGNAFKNGILTVVLPQEAIDRLVEVAETDPIAIDLEHQTVTTPFQDRFTFEIDPVPQALPARRARRSRADARAQRRDRGLRGAPGARHAVVRQRNRPCGLIARARYLVSNILSEDSSMTDFNDRQRAEEAEIRDGRGNRVPRRRAQQQAARPVGRGQDGPDRPRKPTPMPRRSSRPISRKPATRT